MLKTSIDWITVCGNVAEKETTINAVKNYLKGTDWKFVQQGNQRYFELISKVTDKSVARLFTNDYHAGSVRLQTSCHFSNEEEFLQTTKILKILKNPHFTRIDVNVDLVNEDMNNMSFSFARFNAKRIEYRNIQKIKSRNGKLETVYIGAPKSDKVIRYYDKLVERHEKSDVVEFVDDTGTVISGDDIKMWNRIELSVKSRECDNYIDLFNEVLSLLRIERIQMVKDAKQRAMLHSLIDNTIDFSELSTVTGYKYKDMIKKAQGFDSSMSKRLLSYFNNHVDEIKTFVNRFSSQFQN